jgi:hypothetical protein
MRSNLKKILKCLEEVKYHRNEYIDSKEDYCEGTNINIVEIIDFPNYRRIIDKYNEWFPQKKGLIADSKIRAELKRMELDRLITIDIQEGIFNATMDDNGPDYHDNTPFKTEAVILTTLGKSEYKYHLHKAKENLITLVFSSVALVISILSYVNGIR